MPRRSGTGRGAEGVGAFPQLRLVALAETGTQAVVGAVQSPLHQGETNAAPALAAALVWRVRQDLRLPVLAPCADGSYRRRLYPTRTARRRDQDGVDMRVIPDALPRSGTPGAALTALYHERWAIEQIFEEFTTHPRGVGGPSRVHPAPAFSS